MHATFKFQDVGCQPTSFHKTRRLGFGLAKRARPSKILIGISQNARDILKKMRVVRSKSREMRTTSENSGQNPAKHARHSKIPTQTSQIARDILKIRPKTRETRATFENSVQNLAKCARHPNISVKLLEKVAPLAQKMNRLFIFCTPRVENESPFHFPFH